jgi:uncharacterized protein (DUF779 family)
MFIKQVVCMKEPNHQCFEEFYQRMGDVCIGTIEDVEFWVDKDLYEYWKHAHFTLKDRCVWCWWFSMTPFKTFQIEYRIYSYRRIRVNQSKLLNNFS